IPNLGPFLSTIAPTAIALLDSPWKALAVIIAYFLIQQLEQFLLVPIVMGQQVSLLPAVTLLAQIAFASFFGFLGLFLAIPLVIIVRVLVREILVRDVLDQWKLQSVTVDVAKVETATSIALPNDTTPPPKEEISSPPPQSEQRDPE
ncbi:MAG TPA: AI-2E family transporter, partial [Allocoleopsis sp.]